MTLQNELLDILRFSEVDSTNWTLANAVLNYGNEFRKVSIQDLANECHVSESTVSRFAKLVGCKNYIDLKEQTKHLNEESGLALFHMEKGAIHQLKNNPSEFLKEYSAGISESLQNNANCLDLKKIDAFLKEIYDAKRVFIFGTSTSLMMAEIIQSNLINYKKTIYVGFTNEQQLNHLSNVKSTDLVIVISTYGNFIHQSPELIKYLSNSDSRTILLTQNKGLQETFLFDDVIFLSNENSRDAGSYSMFFGIEYLVRRYAVLFKL